MRQAQTTSSCSDQHQGIVATTAGAMLLAMGSGWWMTRQEHAAVDKGKQLITAVVAVTITATTTAHFY